MARTEPIAVLRGEGDLLVPTGRAARWWQWSRAPRWLPPLVTVLALLAVLELFARSGVVSAHTFPPITDDLRTLARELGRTSFWTAVGHTLAGWAIGMGLATALAVPIGVVVGITPMLIRATRVIVEVLRPIPSVALIPLAVLVYGTGLKSKIFLTTFSAFWPLLVQVLYGVQDVDPVATDTARSLGYGRVSRLWRVTLPSSAPYIATGLRIASAIALILAVTTELIIGAPGLGREITLARSGGAFDLMYALIIATGTLGWVLNLLFAWGERRVLHWHPAHRGGTR